MPLLSELRVRRSAQPASDAWRTMPIQPRTQTRLGLSLRAPQIDAFELDLHTAVDTLFAYPFEIVRLGAYWNRIAPAQDVFDPRDLDWQIDAALRTNKQIIVCVGALKTFGYPEYFAPDHVTPPLPEGTRIRADRFRPLLDASTEFITRVVERYRDCPNLLAWQVEHESVDPLGMEHSWRLDRSFVEREVQAVHDADPNRPVLLNGYLPVSLAVGLSQWWQTRDQGDSLDAALALADIVGVDFYPRHALAALGPYTLYLDAGRSPWQLRRLNQVFLRARRVMITEGQAEPWEAVTVPPNWTTFSCPPEQMVATYNVAMRHARERGVDLEAYLFWGAEYWLARQRAGDTSYLQAFARVLDQA